jgi:hypothetical protein
MVEAKLRSFVVASVEDYNKFAEIQRNKGKHTGERLNELIKREVKESDPTRIDHSPIKGPLNPQNIPNPFVYTQPKANKIWLDFLANLDYEDWKRFEILVSEIYHVTTDRQYIENHARIIKNAA